MKTIQRKRLQEDEINLYEDLQHIFTGLIKSVAAMKKNAADVVNIGIEKAKEKSYELNDQLEETIVRKPKTTVLVSVLGGLLIGFLTSRK